MKRCDQVSQRLKRLSPIAASQRMPYLGVIHLSITTCRSTLYMGLVLVLIISGEDKSSWTRDGEMKPGTFLGLGAGIIRKGAPICAMNLLISCSRDVDRSDVGESSGVFRPVFGAAFMHG